ERKISTSKRNRDKFIFSDILTSGTAIIKRGVYNLLTFITLVIGGSEALANSMLPNLKEGVFLINSGKHEISGKKIHAFFALRTLDIKSIPINEYIEEMLKSQNPKKPNAYVTKKMIEIETNGFENRKWNHYLQKTTR
ncbi:MAG: hypothetical protein KGY70_12210, partial [Bacteroidales bacterium]|nr:hypothetical protein [Bacteroidales bacterium]